MDSAGIYWVYPWKSNSVYLIISRSKALVHKIGTHTAYLDHSGQYHHKLHLDSCIMYSQVTENQLKTFKSYMGDTRQISDNLWKEDNFRREDKGRGPGVFSVRRFNSTWCAWCICACSLYQCHFRNRSSRLLPDKQDIYIHVCLSHRHTKPCTYFVFLFRSCSLRSSLKTSQLDNLSSQKIWSNRWQYVLSCKNCSYYQALSGGGLTLPSRRQLRVKICSHLPSGHGNLRHLDPEYITIMYMRCFRVCNMGHGWSSSERTLTPYRTLDNSLSIVYNANITSQLHTRLYRNIHVTIPGYTCVGKSVMLDNSFILIL